MSDSGVKFHIMIGPQIPAPIPAALAASFVSAEVTIGDTAPAGFQLNFQLRYNGLRSIAQDALFGSSLLNTFNRVHLAVQIDGGIPDVLINGIITNHQHQPGPDPGVTTLTLTGEDMTLMMDREEVKAHHKGQDSFVIVQKILKKYKRWQITPNVRPPTTVLTPARNENGAMQKETDRAFIQRLARLNGFVFMLKPSSWKPFASEAYWGPAVHSRLLQGELTTSYGPQKALTVNMGPHSNIKGINFEYNSLATELLSGSVLDHLTNQVRRVRTIESFRPPLAAMPDLLINRNNLQKKSADTVGDSERAQAEAQAALELAMNDVLTATGELDTMRYGGILEPHRLVGLRGAGRLYDGFYYVKEVTHQLSPGSYKQQFKLGREGRGATTPVVRP